ncbi:uncharacterized protein LOC131428997 [Malaya genurostris]|uniref:uncharacterized protein LOC131428997 n=1 Tax=Malaya genurostris TaxID=325434 RepID=UPI0026F38C16|nr:uncharacterized protein LOC131428997 [Malaya genurostris]
MSNRRPKHYFLSSPWYGKKYVKKRRTRNMCVINDVESHPYTSRIPNLSLSDIASDELSWEQNATSQVICIDTPSSKIKIQNQRDGVILPQHTSFGESEVFEELSSTGETSHLNYFFGEEVSGKFNEVLKLTNSLQTFDVMFMLLNFYIRHQLTQQALEDLLSMMNIIVGKKIFPETFSSFTSAFPDKYDATRLYFFKNLTTS